MNLFFVFFFLIKDRERESKCCAVVIDFHNFMVWEVLNCVGVQAFDFFRQEPVKTKREQYANL